MTLWPSGLQSLLKLHKYLKMLLVFCVLHLHVKKVLHKTYKHVCKACI